MEEVDIRPGTIPKEVMCTHAYTYCSLCYCNVFQYVSINVTKTLNDLTL